MDRNSAFNTSLSPVTITTVDDRSKPILEDVIKKNGQVPNMYANMVNSPGVLETYLHGYDIFRRESGFTPVEQEVVFLSISFENACNYCMAAHSVIADRMSMVPVEVTDAIRNGTVIPNSRLQALSVFTKEMFQTRGRPSREAATDFLNAGYDERKILEIILALAVKTLSNYSNHVFGTEVDKSFQSRAWESKTVTAG